MLKINKSTNFLIVGLQNYRILGKSGMNSKRKKVIE